MVVAPDDRLMTNCLTQADTTRHLLRAIPDLYNIEER
jgi:hypothetical protein